MIKLKLKSTGIKSEEYNNVRNVNMTSKVVDKSNINRQAEVKKEKVKISPRKVVYITKRGGKVIFDSIGLCAKIFCKDKTTIKYRIEHPKANLNFDWLEGGRLEYIND